MEAKLIKADGTEINKVPANGKHFTLEELQSFVEGWIEVVWFKTKLMIINEEGKLKQLPLNEKATLIYQKKKGITTDVIVGDAFYCDRDLIK